MVTKSFEHVDCILNGYMQCVVQIGDFGHLVIFRSNVDIVFHYLWIWPSCLPSFIRLFKTCLSTSKNLNLKNWLKYREPIYMVEFTFGKKRMEAAATAMSHLSLSTTTTRISSPHIWLKTSSNHWLSLIHYLQIIGRYFKKQQSIIHAPYKKLIMHTKQEQYPRR